MPQDAFTLYHTAKELNISLKNARVDKINQPGKDTIVFLLRTNDKNVKLLSSSNASFCRLNLDYSDRVNPEQAPSFCMLLRKHLLHAVITNVEAISFERIIRIDFKCRDEMFELCEKSMFCEIMGKYSNVVLTKDGIILGALKTSTLDQNNLRPILPGVKYILPPPQNKTELSNKNESLKTLEAFVGGDFAKFLFTNFKGLSIKTAEEIAFRYCLKSGFNQNVKILNIEEFYYFFKDFYETHNCFPNVVTDLENSDFFILDYRSVMGNKKSFSTISEAVDYYFVNKENHSVFEHKKRKLQDIIKAYRKKLDKKLQIVNEKLLEAEASDELRLKGELIIANLYRLKENVEFCELENYYDEALPIIKIKLDKTISPKKNAEKFFKKYDKLKKTIKSVLPQREELLKEIDYTESVFEEIEQAENSNDFEDITEELKAIGLIKTPLKQSKQRKKVAPFRCYEFKNYSIFVGRNNLQNDRLTQSAERSDVWLHAKDYHSAHVIIKTEGKSVPDEVLLFAAEVCAYYSKARESDKIPVDYTLKKFVKKPSGLKAGKVYYTDFKTLLVTPNAHLSEQK